MKETVKRLFSNPERDYEKIRRLIAKSVLDNFKSFVLHPAGLKAVELKMIHKQEPNEDYIFLKLKDVKDFSLPDYYQGFKVSVETV